MYQSHPEFPTKRISYIVEQTKMSIILTSQKNLKIVESLEIKKFIIMENISGTITPENQEEKSKKNPNLSMDNRKLAYVLFTSVLTGNPKGVMICHRGVVNNLFSWQVLKLKLFSLMLL